MTGKTGPSALKGFFYAVIYITVLLPTCFIAADADLDKSWQWSLGYALAHHLSWGREYIFTFGPLGFLNNPLSYDNHTLWVIAALFTIAVNLLLAFALFLLTARDGRRGFVRILELVVSAAIIRVAGCLGNELSLLLVSVLLIGYCWRTVATLPLIVVVAGCLAVTSLIKGTAFIGALAIIGSFLMSLWIFKRDSREFFRALWLPVAYGLTLLFLWMVTGQSLTNIGSYLVGLGHIVGGYEVMGISGAQLEKALAIVMLAMGICGVGMNRKAELRKHLGLLMTTVPLLVLYWKEGFTRMSLGGYFHGQDTYFFLVLMVVFWIHYLISEKVRQAPFNCFVMPALVTLFLFFMFFPSSILKWEPEKAFSSFTQEFVLNLSPKHYQKSQEAVCLSLQKSFDLDPKLSALLQNKPTLIIPWDLLLAPAYNLPLALSPVPQQYCAYDSYLDQANVRWLDRTEPEQVIYRFESIDARYPLDDPPLLNLEMANRYSFVARDEKYALLAAKAGSRQTCVAWDSVMHTVDWGENIEIPDRAGHMIVAKIDIRKSALGSFLGRFSAPGQVSLNFVLRDGNEKGPFRFVVQTGTDGLIISPFVEGLADYQSLLEGRLEMNVREIRLDIPDSSRWEYQKHFQVSFGSL